jgi:hypothetical protein
MDRKIEKAADFPLFFFIIIRVAFSLILAVQAI